MTVVVGVHEDGPVKGWEPSGLLGVGNARALAEVQVQLDQICVQIPKVVYSHQVEADTLKNNLVLIGGPDCNKITAEVLARLDCTLQFADAERHVVSIVDRRRDEVHNPKMVNDPTSAEAFRLVEDYGLVIRARNPFNPESSVLIICGSFGFGSWAGAQLIRTTSFLKDRLVTAQVPIECLFRTEVVDHTPQAPELLRIRSLDDREATRR